MLKFHDNNTTLIATFEDFILTAYVIIDVLYRRFAPPEVATRRHVLDARLSDPEIITISICGELAGIDSENAPQKRKPILATKYMPWSPWKDMSLHLKSRRHPLMTGKACVTL